MIQNIYWKQYIFIVLNYINVNKYNVVLSIFNIHKYEFSYYFLKKYYLIVIKWKTIFY